MVTESEISEDSEKEKSKAKRPGHGSSGWRKMNTPEEIEKTICTMLNKILMDKNPLAHAGQYAALINSLVNLKKYALEVQETKELAAQVKKLEADLHGNREP